MARLLGVGPYLFFGNLLAVGLAGVGHMVAQERPDVVNAELADLVALARTETEADRPAATRF